MINLKEKCRQNEEKRFLTSIRLKILDDARLYEHKVSYNIYGREDEYIVKTSHGAEERIQKALTEKNSAMLIARRLNGISKDNLRLRVDEIFNFQSRMENVRRKLRENNLKFIDDDDDEEVEEGEEDEEAINITMGLDEFGKASLIDILVKFFFEKEFEIEKRKMENEFFNESEEEIMNSFITFRFKDGKIMNLPRHLFLNILEFLPHDMRTLSRVGRLNKDIYLLFLMSFREIKVKPQTILNISLLVLRSIERIVFSKKCNQCQKEEYGYLFRNILPENLKVLDLGMMIEGGFRKIFESIQEIRFEQEVKKEDVTLLFFKNMRKLILPRSFGRGVLNELKKVGKLFNFRQFFPNLEEIQNIGSLDMLDLLSNNSLISSIGFFGSLNYHRDNQLLVPSKFRKHRIRKMRMIYLSTKRNSGSLRTDDDFFNIFVEKLQFKDLNEISIFFKETNSYYGSKNIKMDVCNIIDELPKLKTLNIEVVEVAGYKNGLLVALPEVHLENKLTRVSLIGCCITNNNSERLMKFDPLPKEIIIGFKDKNQFGTEEAISKILDAKVIVKNCEYFKIYFTNSFSGKRNRVYQRYEFKKRDRKVEIYGDCFQLEKALVKCPEIVTIHIKNERKMLEDIIPKGYERVIIDSYSERLYILKE